jgi:hypothetical protein
VVLGEAGYGGEDWKEAAGSGHGLVLGSCEHVDEPAGSVKTGNLLTI